MSFGGWGECGCCGYCVLLAARHQNYPILITHVDAWRPGPHYRPLPGWLPAAPALLEDGALRDALAAGGGQSGFGANKPGRGFGGGGFGAIKPEGGFEGGCGGMKRAGGGGLGQTNRG